MDDTTRHDIGFGWTWLAAFLFLAALALIVPIDHDEGQYVAATWLTAHGLLPVIDYPYLQTPLQPYLLAPLAWLAPGWLLVASRIANAALVAGAAALTGRLVGHLSGRRAAGLFAVLLFVACDPVEFGGSVARNDALALFLFALGLERLWGSGAPSSRRLAIAGLALGAAASAKASYVLPGGVAGAMAAWHLARHTRREAFIFLGAMFAGTLPTLLTLALAPDRAYFYFVTYSTDGVRAFQSLNHSVDELAWSSRLGELFKFALRGSLLAVGLLAIFVAVRRFSSPRTWPLGIAAGPVLLAALVASVLPMPAYRQYLLPSVVPLLAFVAARGGFGRWASLKSAAGIALGAVFLVLATNKRYQVAHHAPAHLRPIASTLLAHEAGEEASARGAKTIGGIDAVRAVDTGLELDPRFATGPFLYRAGNLPACGMKARCPVTFADTGAAPPDALLVGGEQDDIPGLHGSLDDRVESWAREQGMKEQSLGPVQLWTRR